MVSGSWQKKDFFSSDPESIDARVKFKFKKRKYCDQKKTTEPIRYSAQRDADSVFERIFGTGQIKMIDIIVKTF